METTAVSVRFHNLWTAATPDAFYDHCLALGHGPRVIGVGAGVGLVHLRCEACRKVWRLDKASVSWLWEWDLA